VARYLLIAEHGLIGDLHTVALVGTDGTIDWYCCPRFDSPSVFAAILDADRGGLFRISPDGDGWSSTKPSGARAAQFVCRNDARATFWRIGPPARARTAVLPIFPLPITYTLAAYAALPVIAVVVGVLASLAGVRRAVRVDPATAFAGT